MADTEKAPVSLGEYVDDLHASGQYWFAKSAAAAALDCSPEALRMALVRLGHKGRIVCVMKEFYVIVPQEYRAMGILPPQLFIDDLMKHLGAEYYVGLLSAAAMHGAGHQQPQEFQTVVQQPRRPIRTRGGRLEFFVKKGISKGTKTRMKTDTGYVTVSSPALTALDLVAYQKRIGGLSRVTTVLDELCEVVDSAALVTDASEYPTRAAVQRLGHLLDHHLNQGALVTELHSWLESQAKLGAIPLDPALPVRGSSHDVAWGVLVNTDVESDL